MLMRDNAALNAVLTKRKCNNLAKLRNHETHGKYVGKKYVGLFV